MLNVPLNLECTFCQKLCKSPVAYKQHYVRCTLNPNKIAYKASGKPKGYIPWNAGLTKETDQRVLKHSNTLKGKVGTFLGKKHTEDAKRKIGQKLSINNKGGRAKWYEVAGQKVQGTWERNVALKFEELGIEWKKLKTNKDILEYIMDGKLRCYTPDFYLPAYNVYLEVKGRWWGSDREKMDIVIRTYPDKNIVIVEKEQYEKFLGGELVW